MRLDKYLKVSRLIKRRTVANEACDGVSRIPEGQEILIVIGEGLNEDVLNAYFPSRYSTGRERAAGDQCSVIDR